MTSKIELEAIFIHRFCDERPIAAVMDTPRL
jgi:hypothetical protein